MSYVNLKYVIIFMANYFIRWNKLNIIIKFTDESYAYFYDLHHLFDYESRNLT